ncbi:MAG: enoyl-CoA hydratase/isomerase family protein [Chloroflexi bacterium]|nr:enoyl-CoA hydratase/isomerase family protein [Chloroflexota bacterium]
MAYETILFEKEGPVAIITLNRPQRLNALSRLLLTELGQAVDEIAADKDARVVVVTGGAKCFCAGADISEAAHISIPREAEAFHNLIKVNFCKLEDLDRPVIAAISGVAMGGGLELALACDLRVASETARLGVPEIKIGAIPGAGGTQRLPRAIGVTKAKEMIYVGDPIDAAEAYRLGLVNKVAPVDTFFQEAKAMAAVIASRPRLALKAAKASINNGIELDLRRALDFEIQNGVFLYSTRDREEGMKAFLEKRAPVFTGE